MQKERGRFPQGEIRRKATVDDDKIVNGKKETSCRCKVAKCGSTAPVSGFGLPGAIYDKDAKKTEEDPRKGNRRRR